MMQETFVYVIGRIDADGRPYEPYKVGISGAPHVRLFTFQTGCPDRLHLLGLLSFATRDAAFAVEREFHSLSEAFPDKMAHGEWVYQSIHTMPEYLRNCCQAIGIECMGERWIGLVNVD